MKRFIEIKSVLIKVKLFLLILLVTFILGCGAVSTSGRYESSKTSKDKVENKDTEATEIFDLKPYHPELNLEEKEFVTEGYLENSGAWYEYLPKSDSNRKIVGTEDGYRVQVIATDDLDDANRINGEVSAQITNQKTYVNFEPPFYKVKVGDFNELPAANNMRFRLSQMGYTESIVVRETINIFE